MLLCRPHGFLTGTCQYLPRKRSCAAVLGSWTGTGRRKKPLQGNHASSLVSGRDCTRPSREDGHSPGPGEERGEGQRRPGPAHGAPSSPNSMHSLWEVSAGQLLAHGHLHKYHLWPHTTKGLAGQGWQAGSTQAGRLRHPTPGQGGSSAVHSASSPRTMPIIEELAKEAPVSKGEDFFSRQEPTPKLKGPNTSISPKRS